MSGGGCEVRDPGVGGGGAAGVGGGGFDGGGENSPAEDEWNVLVATAAGAGGCSVCCWGGNAWPSAAITSRPPAAWAPSRPPAAQPPLTPLASGSKPLAEPSNICEKAASIGVAITLSGTDRIDSGNAAPEEKLGARLGEVIAVVLHQRIFCGREVLGDRLKELGEQLLRHLGLTKSENLARRHVHP